jgi:hypothetical protein
MNDGHSLPTLASISNVTSTQHTQRGARGMPAFECAKKIVVLRPCRAGQQKKRREEDALTQKGRAKIT